MSCPRQKHLGSMACRRTTISKYIKSRGCKNTLFGSFRTPEHGGLPVLIPNRLVIVDMEETRAAANRAYDELPANLERDRRRIAEQREADRMRSRLPALASPAVAAGAPDIFQDRIAASQPNAICRLHSLATLSSKKQQPLSPVLHGTARPELTGTLRPPPPSPPCLCQKARPQKHHLFFHLQLGEVPNESETFFLTSSSLGFIPVEKLIGTYI